MSNNKETNNHWILIVTVSTIILASFFSFTSGSILKNLNIYIAFLTLIAIISIGVIFDIIGVASAVSDEKAFHAMAAKKIEIAKYCLFITKNASKVSSFCSDVIGDIAGIISGAAGTIIVLSLIESHGFVSGSLMSVLMSSIIAGLTVGGKALGKDLAINRSKTIIMAAANVLRQVHKIIKFKV